MQKLTAGGWPVEYVGPHQSPNYLTVRYTGEPSIVFGTLCPPANTPNRCSVKAGQLAHIRKSHLMIQPEPLKTREGIEILSISQGDNCSRPGCVHMADGTHGNRANSR